MSHPQLTKLDTLFVPQPSYQPPSPTKSTSELPSPASTESDLEKQVSNVSSDNDNKPSHPPVDHGKHAWLFLIACFFVEGITWGFPFSFGVFEDYYTAHDTFPESSNIAIVGTCALGVMYFGLPIVIGVQRLSPKFNRWSPLIGVLVSSLSVVASSFSQSISHLIITQGVLYAIGATILYCPCIIYLSDWFDKRKGFAYGVMLSGTGLGGCVLPPVLEVLLGRYGFRTTLRAWAISLVILTLPLAYFIKPRLPAKSVADKTNKKANKDAPSPFNLRFVLKRSFILYQVSNICEALGFFLPSIYLPTYARSLGASESLSALTLLFVNFASVFGSAGMGIMTDNFHVTTCFLTSAVGTVIATFFFWGFAKNLPMLFAFCNIYGLFAGSYTTAWQGVVRQITSDAEKEGKEKFDQNMIIGIMAVGRGIGSVASGPLSNLLLQGMPLEGQLLSAYGTGYGALILFTGVSAVMSGATYLWRKLGWM